MPIPTGEDAAVFYNPVQVQNRDLSILMITLYRERRERELQEKWHKKQERMQAKATEDDESKCAAPSKATPPSVYTLNILDALAASGLRSLRYWKEIPHVHHVTINDLEEAAVERARTNIAENQLMDAKVDNRTSKGLWIRQGDAMDEMYATRATSLDPTVHSYNVIDLDPYGSASPFLDATLQAIADGGLVNITCTDLIALGGSRPETCFGRYAAQPLQRAPYLHEVSLRILWYTIHTTAARYGRTVRPLLSVGMDFYVRVFGIVSNDKAGVQRLAQQMGYVYQSTKTPAFVTLPSGMLGGKKGTVFQASRLPKFPKTVEDDNWKVGGPLYLGPLHDKELVQEALQRLGDDQACQHLATRERLQGLLTSCANELDVPLFYQIPQVCKALKLSVPSHLLLEAALTNAGYKVSGFHKEPFALKTDAPFDVLMNVLSAWAKKENHKLKEGTLGATLLSTEPTPVDFCVSPALRASFHRRKSAKRFPQNPQSHWGPKPRAHGNKRKRQEEENGS